MFGSEFWKAVLEKQGFLALLVLLMAGAIGAGIKWLGDTVVESVPVVVKAINAGYASNSAELNQAASTFERTATRMLEQYQNDRIRDQALIVQLIIKGNLTGETVSEAMEVASEKAPPSGS